MKKALVLALVLFGVFCFATATFAEGFTISGDYTFTEPINGARFDVDFLAVNGTYDLDPFVIGGTFALTVGIDPPLPPGLEMMEYLYGVYGGYKIINADTLSLAALAGYYVFKSNVEPRS